ncbi:MAG: hypothetical protein H7Y38_05165 [Armatimonadetes bacterium]|nr:hypothetical protein [Armatimonadota bacterium]
MSSDIWQGVSKWVTLLGGGYGVYRGLAALVTGHATLSGRRGISTEITGTEAAIFGWVALVLGIGFLFYAAVQFHDERRQEND